jgi:hypothetical protein
LHDLASIVQVFRKKGKFYLHSEKPGLFRYTKVPPPRLLELYPAKEDKINTSTDKAHLRKTYRPKNNFILCVFPQENVNMIGNWML